MTSEHECPTCGGCGWLPDRQFDGTEDGCPIQVVCDTCGGRGEVSKEVEDKTGQAIEKAAECLPDGYEIHIRVETGAAWVVLTVPSGHDVDFHFEDTISDAITEATAYAIRRSAVPKDLLP